MAQVLNQFIKELRSSILRSIKPRHLTSLQDAVALTRDLESAEQEANHTQAVNLAINGTSDIDTKITQLSEKLTQKIERFLAGTTGTYQPPQWRENNNNSRYLQQQNCQQQQQPWRSDPHNCYYCQKPEHIARDCRRKIIDQNQGNSYQQPRYQQNMVQTNSGLSRPIPCSPAQFRPTPTGYPNQAFYLGLMEDQDFDKSTLVERGDIERISQPSKQTKSNILPATITEDTTLATIFPFDINNLNTHSLFSGAAINQNKPIMVLYTNTRVRRIDIKLILDSRSAGSIITKQFMNQLGRRVDRAATARIITVDRNTKTLIEEIDNFPFEINGIQIPIKVLVMEATQYQALHAQVPATCRYFKTQHTEEPLIKFEDTSMPPTIKTYQVSWVNDYQTELLPPPTWEKKGKGRAKEEPQSSSLRYPTTTKYYCRPYKWDNTPCLICGEILPDEGLWNDVPSKGRTCDETCQYTILINNWVQKETLIKNAWKQALNRLNEWQVPRPKASHPKKYEKSRTILECLNIMDLITPRMIFSQMTQMHFRTNIRNWLANLNTKLCNHYLILCHFQYYNKCDLMFKLPPRILFPITKLSEPEEEYLAYSDLSKELELKWYSDNKEGICPERVHDTDVGFDLQYPGQSLIIIAPHSLVKIDLKIALKILVNTMKKINIKRRIIDAGYTGNIIVMLQNNLNRPYKIKSQEKIAQAIFLSLLGLTAQEINGFGSSGRGNIPVNFMKEDSNQIQDQALLFEASSKICSLANVVNLYLLAKAHKHFKIPIHNLTENVIEIPAGTLISSISTDIQNSEKPQSIPDFAQLFLFCNITSQVWNLPKESYLFTPEEINKLNLGNLSTLQQMQFKVLLNQYVDVFASENEFRCTDIVKHQINTGDARPIKQ
ncbi:hypothetical protein G9A89_005745 [Geosiphon pyriformis]|nr:hypothetical protein G9A89_005745 [Geosiphon pyriformis]